MDLKIAGGLLAVFSALFFAIRFLLVRKATVTGETLDAVLVTIIVDTAIFLPLGIFLNYPNFKLSISSLFAFIGAGIFAPFLGLILLYESTRRIGPSRASPIARGSMMISALIGIGLLGEHATLLHLLGIFVLLLGVIIVSYESKSLNSGPSPDLKWGLNMIFPLGSMLCLGLAYPLMKFGFSKTPITVGSTIIYITALSAMTIFFFYKGRSPLDPFESSEKYIYLVAGFVHFIAVTLFYCALSFSPVVYVAPIRSISPIFVLLLSFVFLSRLEKINYKLIFGVILTVIGGILIGYFV